MGTQRTYKTKDFGCDVPQPEHPLAFQDSQVIVELAMSAINCNAAAISGRVTGQCHTFASTDGYRADDPTHRELVEAVLQSGDCAWTSKSKRPPSFDVGIPLKGDGQKSVGVLTLSGFDRPQFSCQDDHAVENLRHVAASLLRTQEAHRVADERQAELHLTLEQMDQGLTVFDADARLVLWNQRYVDLFELDPSIVFKGVCLRDLIAVKNVETRLIGFTSEYDAMLAELRAGLARGEVVTGGAQLHNGRIVSSVHTAMPNGGWVATHSDVTDRVRAEEKIKHASEHDSMTGLVNRSKFAHEFERVTGEPCRVVTMLIDIDNFKAVNDNFGHGAGDAVIVGVAERLKACVRRHDVVARLGGDEFAVLLRLDQDASPAEAGQVAQNVLGRMREHLMFNHTAIDFSVSIGAYELSDTAEGLEGALSRADFALYKAKQEGRGVARFFDQKLAGELERSKLFSSMVTKETYDDKLDVHFQPIVCLSAARDCSFEALIRWAGGKANYLSPMGIIEAAEQNGAISCLGDWVLNKALEAHRRWGRPARIAVNLSPRQLGNGAVVEQVQLALDHHKVSPTCLELEVTETAVLQDEASFEELHALKKLGVQIALDDFGTGYSSLTLLQRFPFDKIKIDRSFIAKSDKHAHSGAIVKSVVGLGHALGIETVAEGIETQLHLDTMTDLGCALGQGYFLGRPMPSSHIAQRLADAKKAA